MIIYNITTKVHIAVDAAWQQWLRDEYIPEIMATGLFTAYKILRLMEQDDSDGYTYAVQYTAPAAEQYDKYIHVHAPSLRKKAIDKWGERIISFHSVLEVMH